VLLSFTIDPLSQFALVIFADNLKVELLLALNSLFQSGLPFGMSENHLVIIHNAPTSCSPFSVFLEEPLAEKSEIEEGRSQNARQALRDSDFCLLTPDFPTSTDLVDVGAVGAYR
jgi:hypothetical protein